MKSFWELFFNAIPLGVGIVLSLISIAYTSKVISSYHTEDTITAAIIFGMIGFPMVIASSIRFTKKFNEN
jgi:hypothetical protein